MRIICDHCSRPISGTVKKLTGNFNFHPDCLAELVQKAPKTESTDSSFRGPENHPTRADVNGNG